MTWEDCDSIEPELQQVTPLPSDPEIGRLETVMFRGNVQNVNLARESNAELIVNSKGLEACAYQAA